MARHSSDTVLLAAEGSIGKYTLPDGTRLWLNGGSTLTYNSDFDDSAERRVSIDGEAYFEVTRNPRRPFIVEMESMDVKVLGTSFSTRSYPYSGAEDVILLSGKVELNSPLLPDALIMRPDQKVTLDRIARQAVVESANARAYCRWIEPVTTFDNEPLGDILILLSRRYGLDISVNDSAQVDTSHVNNTKQFTTSLDEVISIIEHIIPVKITADGNSLYSCLGKKPDDKLLLPVFYNKPSKTFYSNIPTLRHDCKLLLLRHYAKAFTNSCKSLDCGINYCYVGLVAPIGSRRSTGS